MKASTWLLNFKIKHYNISCEIIIHAPCTYKDNRTVELECTVFIIARTGCQIVSKIISTNIYFFISHKIM